MNGILSVGLILLSALAAGHVTQLARIPEVTGYLLVGIGIGPAGLDLIPEESLAGLQFLSEVALGLILFSIGTIFDAATFRRIGPRIVLIAICEAGAAFVLVTATMLTLGFGAATAVLLGVVAMETAPATTLMVLHEYDAQGTLTETVLALLAVNNILVLVGFGVATTFIQAGLLEGVGGPVAFLARSTLGMAWGIVGSIALGAVLALLLDVWSARVTESGEAMILSIGVVLVAVGAARALELSPLIVTLALGATFVNASWRSAEFSAALGAADPPLYAAFFVLAGAELKPEMLAEVGAAGLLYAVMRSMGKLSGAYAAARYVELPPLVGRHLGWCLLSSSSLAIGLTIQIRARFPSLAPDVVSIVLAAVIVFEIVGPLLTRAALFRAGEARTQPTLLLETTQSH